MAMEGGGGGGGITGGRTIGRTIGRTGVSTVLDWPGPPGVVVYKPVLRMSRAMFWIDRTFAEKVTVPVPPNRTGPTLSLIILVVLLYNPPWPMLSVASSSQSSRRSVMI